MQYRHLHKDINTDDDAATSYKHMMHLCAVTPEIMFLICVPSYGYWANIGLRSPFVASKNASVSKRVGRLKCRWARDGTCTFHINLVGFYLVLLQLMPLNCVQQTSISTRVNSSMFTSGQHVCVSLRLARGQHCCSRWAIRMGVATHF